MPPALDPNPDQETREIAPVPEPELPDPNPDPNPDPTPDPLLADIEVLPLDPNRERTPDPNPDPPTREIDPVPEPEPPDPNPDSNPDPTPDPRLEGLPVLPRHLSVTNPPESMPEVGSHDFELLLEETDGASGDEGFDYEAYMAGSDRNELLLTINAASYSSPESYANPAPPPEPEKDPIGDLIAPVYLEVPPATMPKIGTLAYALLAKEIGVTNEEGEILEGFSYKAHIHLRLLQFSFW